MRIFFLTVTRVPDVPSPLVAEVMERLRGRGHEVESGICERMLVDAGSLAPAHDLYLLKSHTDLALSVASSLAEQGARLLNPLASCTAAQDKLRAHRRLEAAGLPVPRTFVTGDYAAAAELLEPGRPLLLKPLRGHRGAGIEIVRRDEDLRDRAAPATPLLVQDFVPGTGEDLKVYVVGTRVWAVRKAFSPTSFTRPGRPVPVTREIRDLALRAGAATGLGLFGLDVIESPTGPVVVDLNYFPGYKGCVGVAEPMADYVDGYARGDVELELPPLEPAREPRDVAGRALEPVG